MITKKDQAIKYYLSGLTIAKAAVKAGISYPTLQIALKKLNLSRSNKINSRKYVLQEDFFNVINTEEKAYWLGFLYADGHISHHKTGQKIVCVSQKVDDIGHIEKFKLALNATYPIKVYESTSYGVPMTYARLFVTCDKMFDDLVDKGCIENKSLILTFPSYEKVSKNLIRHFIRGYFDGDGSFAKNKKQLQVKICGTTSVLTGLWENSPFKGKLKLYKRHKDDKDNWYLSVGGMKQVKMFGNWLYESATIYLNRKKQIFDLYFEEKVANR